MADASILAPMIYIQIVLAAIAGILVFSERPDTLTLTGAVLIIATGLYTVLRERRLARRAALQA